MKFGRAYGMVLDGEDGLMLTVTLEHGRQIDIVRRETVRRFNDDDDLDWLADQYTQETIGNELAELGWEVVARGDSPVSQAGIGQSFTYSVRNL